MPFTPFRGRRSRPIRCALLGLLGLMLPLAWSSADAAEPEGANAKGDPLPYTAVFEHYKPWSEPEIAPWPAVNDTVRTVGGWRTYAREAMEASQNPHPDTHSHGEGKP
ncbi:MAG TPA: hypothetical protein VGE55_12980 [Limnobacter sp.]|uniref:hypothetical protein n=1 Tax=Limnobacter sp. TaxID=2003368 RepID=UPI002EDB17D3